MSTANISPESFLGGTWTQIQNRFLLAAGSSYTAGSTGGAATVALTTAQMPAHTHVENSNAWRNCGVSSGTNYYDARHEAIEDGMYMNVANTDSISSGNQTTGSTGSGSAHNNMPPYLVVYMWRRTA